ncbi:hypothetical protein HRbin26_02221 [bacterium HR26]|nr:hypothetical protein HRbin26_02221 [bacterium HR26]
MRAIPSSPERRVCPLNEKVTPARAGTVLISSTAGAIVRIAEALAGWRERLPA